MAVIQVAWLWPQLLIAGIVARLPRKRPLLVGAAWVSRPILLALAVVVALWGAVAPTLIAIVTILSLFVFFGLDAVVSVPWYDFLGRAIPPRKRGLVLGGGQIGGGIGGIFAGLLVRYALSADSPWPFPHNYALLFACGGIALMISAVALSFLHEPETTTSPKATPSVRAMLSSLPRTIAEDPPFRRLVTVQIASGFVGIATAFYVLHATTELGLATAYVGLFLVAQVAGNIASGLVMGIVQHVWGPLYHIRLIITLSSLPPVLALVAGSLAPLQGGGLTAVYLLLFFIIGVYTGSFSQPYMNWILEHATEEIRPLYIGLLNTLNAVTIIAPILGGWVVRSFSYPVLFALALGAALIALGLSRKLLDPRAPSLE